MKNSLELCGEMKNKIIPKKIRFLYKIQSVFVIIPVKSDDERNQMISPLR